MEDFLVEGKDVQRWVSLNEMDMVSLAYIDGFWFAYVHCHGKHGRMVSSSEVPVRFERVEDWVAWFRHCGYRPDFVLRSGSEGVVVQ